MSVKDSIILLKPWVDSLGEKIIELDISGKLKPTLMTLSRKSLLDYIIEALKAENLKLKSWVDSLGEKFIEPDISRNGLCAVPAHRGK